MSKAMSDRDYLDEMFWADYLLFEIGQGNVDERTDVTSMKADFMLGLRGEAFK